MIMDPMEYFDWEAYCLTKCVEHGDEEEFLDILFSQYLKPESFYEDEPKLRYWFRKLRQEYLNDPEGVQHVLL